MRDEVKAFLLRSPMTSKVDKNRLATARQQIAFRIERDRRHTTNANVTICSERAQQLPRRHVPHLDDVVAATACQQFIVGTECQTLHGWVAVQPLKTTARPHVQQIDLPNA